MEDAGFESETLTSESVLVTRVLCWTGYFIDGNGTWRSKKSPKDLFSCMFCAMLYPEASFRTSGLSSFHGPDWSSHSDHIGLFHHWPSLLTFFLFQESSCLGSRRVELQEAGGQAFTSATFGQSNWKDDKTLACEKALVAGLLLEKRTCFVFFI